MSNEKMTIEHLYQPQERFVTIKVDRGQKGGYGWEIKAEAKTVDEAVALTQEADQKLQETYLNKEVKKDD